MHCIVDLSMKKVFDAHLRYCTWADQLCYADTTAQFIPNVPSSPHVKCNAKHIFLSGKSLIDLEETYT